MIKVDNIDVWGFEHAIRGMRNPMNSWKRSDSEWKYWCTDLGIGESPHYCNNCGYDMCSPTNSEPDFVVGNEDLCLMRKLYKAGTEHRTYARMIQVSMDIVAPLYWWKEMDRYTIGKSQVSCSTMHKIAAKEFELDDFSHEHLLAGAEDILQYVIDSLNNYRNLYLKNKDKDYWWQMIQLLPSSYNQRRTVCMSYETVFKIIKERIGHKLTEWEDFVALLRRLPYVEEIIDGSET